MTSPTGNVVEPILDGEQLTGATQESFQIDVAETKAIRELANGSKRAFYVYQGAGLPLVQKKRTFTLKWASLRALYDLVEPLMAVPDPHTLCVWKLEHLAYYADGSRTEFTLPWVPALHTLSPARGLTTSRFAAVVEHGIGAGKTTYTVADVSQAAYDAGSPPSGVVWFRDQDTVFKFLVAPAPTKRLFVRYVPLFQVVSGAQSSKQYQDNSSEPRDLVLQEM